MTELSGLPKVPHVNSRCRRVWLCERDNKVSVIGLLGYSGSVELEMSGNELRIWPPQQILKHLEFSGYDENCCTITHEE